MQQTVKGGHGTNIGKQSQLLAHGQQTSLGTNLRRRVIVILQVAHGGKQHGIGTHADIVGSLRIGVAHGLDGRSTDECLLIVKLMSKLLGNSVHDGHTLLHDLRTYSVARKNGNS